MATGYDKARAADAAAALEVGTVPAPAPAPESHERQDTLDGRPVERAVLADVAGWGARYARRLAVTDAMAILLAAVCVHVFRFDRLGGSSLFPGGVRVPVIVMTTSVVAVWFVALGVGGTRLHNVVGHGPAEYKRVAEVTLWLFGAVAILSYVFRLDLPRTYPIVMMPIGFVGVFVTRYGWRRWLHSRRDYGHFQSSVVAVGSVAAVRGLVREMQRSPRAGYRVAAVCLADATEDVVPDLEGLVRIARLDDLPAALAAHGLDTVAVTSSPEVTPDMVRKLSWDLEGSGASLVMAPALTDIAGPRIHTQPVNGLHLIHVDLPTWRGANRLLKRAFDVVGSATLLVLLAVPLALLALAVRVTSRGPAFFHQERVGINGSTFRMVKFRSMVVNAETLLQGLAVEREAAGHDAGNDVLFKMKDDPRVTPLGRVMRRFSLDELPQLFNVLGGSMSLVGPRPPLVSEVEHYCETAHRRLLVKPGVTGLWQVSGRSSLSWEESIRLDSYYVENWSITGDLVILWKTARAVVGGGGAF